MTFKHVFTSILFASLASLSSAADLRMVGYAYREKTVEGTEPVYARLYVYIQNIGKIPVKVITECSVVISNQVPAVSFVQGQALAVDGLPLKLSESALGITLLNPNEMTALPYQKIDLSTRPNADYIHVCYFVDAPYGTQYGVFFGEIRIEVKVEPQK